MLNLSISIMSFRILQWLLLILLLLYNNVQHSLQQSLNINLAVDSTADDFYMYVL